MAAKKPDIKLQPTRQSQNNGCLANGMRSYKTYETCPETREILRQYKAVINARHRENGESVLRTEQVIDEICYYMACQNAVFIRQDGYDQ